MADKKKCEHYQQWRECPTCKDAGCSTDGCEKQTRKRKRGVFFADSWPCATCSSSQDKWKCSLCGEKWRVCDDCHIGGCEKPGCEKKTWRKADFFSKARCISDKCKK